MKRKMYFLLLAFVAITFLSNCSRGESQSVPLISETKTSEATLLPTAVGSVTQISTLTPQKTPTVLPIVSLETAKEILIKFLQTNGGCKLPCVLGLTPGDSGQVETSAFQSYFQSIEHPLDLQDNKVGIKIRMRDNGAGIRFQFWNEGITSDLSLGYYTDRDVVSQIILNSWANQSLEYGAKSLFDDPNYMDTMKYFSLAHILDTYGPPSEILIAPFLDDPGHPSPPAQYPFSIVLNYAQRGFLVQYVSPRGQNDIYYIGCPTNAHIDISAWDPTKSIGLTDAVAYFSGVDSINTSNIEFYKNIDEATEFTISTFYEAFKISDAQNCIQTRKDIWHLP